MIETVMLILLGFLASSVLWLLGLPALSRRADRLARRRAELTFPLSVAEISAERDHLRAEFAVQQRELERRMEQGQAARSAALAELGSRDVAISDLKGEVARRDATIGQLTAELTATEQDLGTTRIRLASEEAGHVRTRDDLAVKVQVLAERDAEIAQLRIVRADLTANLARTREELAQAVARGETLDANLAALNAKHEALQRDHGLLGDEKDRLRILLADSETHAAKLAAEIVEHLRSIRTGVDALDIETARHAETQQTLAARIAEVGALVTARDSLARKLADAEAALANRELDVAQLTTTLTAANGRVADARKQSAEISRQLDDVLSQKAKVETAAASAAKGAALQLAALQADAGRLREQLVAVKAERAAVKQEVMTLRRAGETAVARLDVENAQLRAEIMRVADSFLGRNVPPSAGVISRPPQAANPSPVTSARKPSAARKRMSGTAAE